MDMSFEYWINPELFLRVFNVVVPPINTLGQDRGGVIDSQGSVLTGKTMER